MTEQELISRIEAIEKRLDIIENKRVEKITIKKSDQKEWYKRGSTIEKIIILVHENFFNSPKKISEIIEELKGRDYHLKASDLTLPLRKIVRKNILKKTKKFDDGSPSKKWIYVKN